MLNIKSTAMVLNIPCLYISFAISPGIIWPIILMSKEKENTDIKYLFIIHEIIAERTIIK